MANTAADIKKFLGTTDKPLESAEFTEFWKALSEEEKDEFRNTDLGGGASALVTV